MRRALVAFWLSIALIAAGCGPLRTAHPPLGPTNLPVSTPVPSGAPAPVGLPGDVLAQVGRLRQVYARWHRTPDENYAWVLLDEQGQIVLLWNTATLDDDEGLAYVVKQVREMFATPEVDRAVLISTPVGNAQRHDLDFYGMVSRKEFQGWPGTGDAIPFARTEFKNHLDYYAERTVPQAKLLPRLFDKNAFIDELRRWVQGRLGDRLIRIDVQQHAQPQPRGMLTRGVTIVARPGTLDEHGRVQEAARLLAIMSLTINVEDLAVQYEGVNKVGRITDVGLDAWASDSGDPGQVANWLQIDGQGGRLPHSDIVPGGKPEDLPALLRKREQIKGMLPDGGQILIGLGDSSNYGTVAVEAQVPESQTWEQAWTQYQRFVDRVYAEVPEALQVVLILHRGHELETFYIWRYPWEPQTALAKLAGEPLDPGLFPLRSYLYDRFTVVP